MSGKRHTDEFKIEAVRQVTERRHKVAEVASRLGVTTCSWYAGIRRFGKAAVVQHTITRPVRVAWDFENQLQ